MFVICFPWRESKGRHAHLSDSWFASSEPGLPGFCCLNPDRCDVGFSDSFCGYLTWCSSSVVRLLTLDIHFLAQIYVLIFAGGWVQASYSIRVLFIFLFISDACFCFQVEHVKDVLKLLKFTGIKKARMREQSNNASFKVWRSVRKEASNKKNLSFSHTLACSISTIQLFP